MLSRQAALTALEIALRPAADLYVGAGVNRDRLTRFLEDDLRASLCEPFLVEIEELRVDTKIQAGSAPLDVYCVASRSGTYLLYHPPTHRFFGAHGQAPTSRLRQAIQASPLACWAGAVHISPNTK